MIFSSLVANRRISLDNMHNFSSELSRIGLRLVHDNQLPELKAFIYEAFANAISGLVQAPILAIACAKLQAGMMAVDANMYSGPTDTHDPLCIPSVIVDILWLLDADLDASDETPSTVSQRRILVSIGKCLIVS